MSFHSTQHGVLSHYSTTYALPLQSTVFRPTIQLSVPSLYLARCAVPYYSARCTAGCIVPLLGSSTQQSVRPTLLCTVCHPAIFSTVYQHGVTSHYSAACAVPLLSTVCHPNRQRGVSSHTTQQGVSPHYSAGCAIPLLRPSTQLGVPPTLLDTMLSSEAAHPPEWWFGTQC